MTLPIPSDATEAFRYDPDTGRLFRVTDGFGRPTEPREIKAKNIGGYYSVRFHAHTFSAHRVIWFLMTGDPNPEGVIDHINGDPSDNRFANLRLASFKDNCRNQRPKGRVGSKGVYFYKARGKFCASIRTDDRRIFLGYYDTEAEAAAAYRAAAIKHHGEFARVQ